MVTSNDSLSYVVWYQSPLHPELSSPAGNERGRRYNVDGFWPSAFFDGFYRAPQEPNVDSFFSLYTGMAGQARSVSSVLSMAIDTANTRVDSALVHVGIHITATDTSVDHISSLMLAAVVFEDSAPFKSLVGGDSLYARFCGRCVIGDTLGWGVPLKLHFGSDFDTVLTTAPWDTLDGSVRHWNRSRLGVVVLVQDTSSLRVMQSVSKFRF